VAEVRLGHGHLRIANALMGAILRAPFTGTQVKVVLCLIRLTDGWQRGAVSISRADLAERCGLAPTGGFDRQLDELIREGIVRIVERGHGRTPSAYEINKDFEDWGRFSVAEKALERLFGERPLTPTGGEKLPTRDEGSRPPQGDSLPPIGGDGGPHRGQHIEPKSAEAVELTDPKDSETQERQLLLQRASAFAVKLVGAANNANAERFGDWTRTRPYHWSSATQLCTELLLRNADEDVACLAVATAIRATKKDKPASMITYFAGVIDDALKASEQRALDERNPAPKGQAQPTRMQVAVRRGGEVFVASKDREEFDRRKGYEKARADAGVAWAKDPTNSTRYASIVTAANAAHAATLTTPWGRTARDREVISRCADAAGFPPFPQWEAKRASDALHEEPSQCAALSQ
jgi:hypothetical protein